MYTTDMFIRLRTAAAGAAPMAGYISADLAGRLQALRTRASALVAAETPKLAKQAAFHDLVDETWDPLAVLNEYDNRFALPSTLRNRNRKKRDVVCSKRAPRTGAGAATCR
jgi:hypothetical protein